MPDRRQLASQSMKAAEEWTQRLHQVMEVVSAICALSAKMGYESKHTECKRGVRALAAITAMEIAAEHLMDYASLPAVDAIDAWGLARMRVSTQERGEK